MESTRTDYLSRRLHLWLPRCLLDFIGLMSIQHWIDFLRNAGWRARFTNWRKKYFYTKKEAYAFVEYSINRTREHMQAELFEEKANLLRSAMGVATAKAGLNSQTGIIKFDVQFSVFLLRTPHEKEFLENLCRKVISEIRAQDEKRIPWKGYH